MRLAPVDVSVAGPMLPPMALIEEPDLTGTSSRLLGPQRSGRRAPPREIRTLRV